MTAKEEAYNPLISVIVPVYNVEKYIHRCVDSILGQTYTNLEVILIDDGSPDKCGEICDEYASADARVKVIHQENAGLSEARNAGLDICTGDYVAFVDSDDYIEVNMYEKLLVALIENEADISICQWQYELPDGLQVVDLNKVDTGIYGKKTAVKFAEYFYRGQYEGGVVCAAWNKLYKRCVFDSIRFYGRYVEDDRVHNSILSKSYSIIVITDQLYIYCNNEESLTNKPFRAESLMYLDVLDDRLQCFKDNEFITDNTRRLYCNIYIEYYFKAKDAGVEMRDIKLFDEILRTLIFTGKASIKFIIRMILFRISPKLYAKICKIK